MRTRTDSFRIGLLTIAALLVAGPAGYACFLRSPRPMPQPVQVWLDHIHVDIVDQVAVKTYTCTFRNPNTRAIVGGTCYMELEPGAQVDDMSVRVNGKELKAEILTVKKANQVFNDIVRQGGSPALLEYYGNQLIRTRIPRVAAGGTVKVVLQYTTVLKKRGSLIRLHMLNTNPKASMQKLKSASVTVNIRSHEPIKNVYSPTHKIKLVEKKDWDVSVEWSQKNYLPRHPFVLYYQVATDPVAAALIAHREPGEDGAFMLMLSPTLGRGTGQVSDAQILPKDVVFCVDTSGSMLEGNKMEQARAALKYCIKSLRPGDRFNIVDFSTVARSFHKDGLVQATAANREKALRYVARLTARGGTAIAEAMAASLDHLRSGGHLKMIVFATDGLPTIGERNTKQLLKLIKQKNRDDVRIFAFGEGFDVNTRLLDFVALDNRGEADYILPKEDITKKIGRFFDRVGSPIMTDLKIEFDGIAVQDVYPRRIPDIFKGEQVILYGRYTGSGRKTVRLSGTINGVRRTLEYTVDFPERSNDDRSAFVPRLWAGRKVSFLLNEIRQSEKPSKELVDEVTSLAERYGIITPYTSYLMAEDIAGRPVTPRPVYRRKQLLKKLAADRAATVSSAPQKAKENGFRDAKNFAKTRSSLAEGSLGGLDEEADLYRRRAGRKGPALAAIRYIGTKTFYRRGDVWYESTFDAAKQKNLRTVRIGSKEYFTLLTKDTRAAKYLALGKVVLTIGGRWYRVQ